MYKIMVVEDDINLSTQLADALNRWGFDPIIVEDFENIIQEYIQNKPHLVIMDVNLPYFDGFHWCRQIRELGKVPIIFLSSRDSSMDIVMAVNMGGDDYITKPFSLDILIAKINALLRRTYSYHENSNEVIEHMGVILNLKDSSLHYKDEKLELTRNELKILSLLMNNSEKIISRDRVMKALWDDDTFINDNTLTVNINRLRAKLAEIDLDGFITTKKGQGYVIL